LTQKNDLNFRGRILDETLKPIPDIPEELKQAARDGTLIPFIGAGVSSLVGCPRWREFADDVLKFFIKNGALDYNEFEQLKKLPPRTVLSIAQDLEKSTGHNIPYDLIIEGKKKNHTGENIYHHLSRLSDKFITTNYDRWLKLKPNNNDNWQQIKDQVNTEEREFIYRDFCENLQKNDIVFQIHGSLNNFKSMVVSTSDYLKRYLGDKDAKTIDEENDLLRFLEYVFDNYTVLFIGYGLEELEILEYILLKAGHSKTPRHYILQGFYSNQYKLMKRMENYFKNHCKVTMIPFSLDKKEWNQLEDILKDYANKLPNYRHPIFHKIQTLNNLSKKLKEGETYRDSFIKTMISNEETEIDEDSKLQIEDKGFELLLKSNDPSIYFDQLKGNNVFNLERRQRVETSNSQWPPLHYLYIITENIDFTPEFVSDLVGIMGNIINSIKNGQFPFEKWMLSRKFLKATSNIEQIMMQYLFSSLCIY
jgi:SIR2-like protein